MSYIELSQNIENLVWIWIMGKYHVLIVLKTAKAFQKALLRTEIFSASYFFCTVRYQMLFYQFFYKELINFGLNIN